MNRDSTKNHLSEEQRLQLHQLRLYEWMEVQQPKGIEEVGDNGKSVPKRWELTRGIKLYDWQDQCIERWFREEYKGTAKVVTGGGKTILGLAIAQKLQNEVKPSLHVAIVVPTVVLMHQWYDELLSKGNLPPKAIGRLGGGYTDDFKDCRILIAVLASAHKQLNRLVRSGRHHTRLLLIADECHRAGATEMSRVFDTPRAYNLGLSATPERADEEGETSAGYNDSLLGRELGPIICDFNLKQALELGVVPRFTIRHYGIPLTLEEQQRYDALSRSITERQAELRPSAPLGRESGPQFFSWVRGCSTKESEIGSVASRLIGDISRRKELLYRCTKRGDAVENLLNEQFAINPETRAILFHEQIDEVMEIFDRLQQAGFRVIAEHSRLPSSIREDGLNLFRQGTAKVIVSARSLIEGFNVPAVDVGIIVASSGSVRQRIQSLGRVLRRHQSRDGEEKTSVVHVLYARNTVDDQIYGKVDWDRITGVEQNIYFEWDPPLEPERKLEPPKHPLPSEEQITVTQLCSGDEYPGRYVGIEYTCDTRGNIQDQSGMYASNPGTLADDVRRVKGGAGRFRITPKLGFVLVLVRRNEDWVVLFVRQQIEPLEFEQVHSCSLDPQDWVRTASTGDDYPFADIPIKRNTIKFKQKRGGVLSRQVKNGEVYARVGDKAKDPSMGADAMGLLDSIRRLRMRERQVSTLEINECNHVLHRTKGRLVFVYALKSGLEFPAGTGAR